MMRQETLHLTLAFLGATPQDRVRQLVRAAPGWPVPDGQVVMSRFGRFQGPRIVWAGPGGGDTECVQWLDAVYDRLWSHLESMGWQRPGAGGRGEGAPPSDAATPRPAGAAAFRPHVSLLRRAGPGDLAALERPSCIWRPRQCVLVASRPRESGSLYQVIARMPLA